MNDSEQDIETDDQEGVSDRDIAIIGMAGRFPGGRDLVDYWRLLEEGREAIGELTDEELLAAGTPREVFSRPGYVKAASLIEGVEEFDAEFFGYNARDAEILDPQQRLFLEHAWNALEDAGHTGEGFDGLIGVYAGVAWNTYLLSNLVSHPELFADAGAFQVFISSDKDFMPTRASYKLNLKGPSVSVQTSCSTSLVAVHMACLALQSYECDMALVGGVTVKVPGVSGYFHQEGGLASPDGHCRTFDARAAGTVFGSGVGVVVLRRLAEALEDGDDIRAVIRGSAINNDGSVKVSYTAPSVEGQAEVIAAAQEMADVDLKTLGYVECHGTATSLGDPIEVRALSKVFGESTEKQGFCGLGSVKSNIGHLDAAAGVAGLIKTVLALEQRKIPPSLHYESPNPAIDFAGGPFYVARELEDWRPQGEAPRRAGVSSFGVGGTNAHVVLEEAPAVGREAAAAGAPAAGALGAEQLLVLSARTDTALEHATERLAEHLAAHPDLDLADVAYTLRRGRVVHRHRWIAVCQGHADAVAALAGRRAERTWASVDTAEPRARPVAFLFSGQGSQYVGMARGLYEGEEVFRRAMDQAAEVLQDALGEDLREILWPGADPSDPSDSVAEKLTRTRYAQPALFAVEYATAELWRSWGVEAQALLGHSIGEYVAATLAGVMQFEDALRLVAARGRLMDELPSGAMLAVPLDEGELSEILPAELSVAAWNELGRAVVSGPHQAIEAFTAVLAERDVPVRRLHTSHAFHSAMMDPILENFTAEVRKISLSAPTIPFLSNLSGTWTTAEQATDPGYWARHLRGGVRFADAVAVLCEDPARVFLEVGPGRTLATLAGRHPARRPEQIVLTSLRHPQDEEHDQATVLGTLGRLWLAGVAVDPDAFWGGERRRRVPLPTYPFERRRYWIEPGARAARSEAAVTPSLEQQPDLADWFYLPSWKPSVLSLMEMQSSMGMQSEELPERWLVLAPDESLGHELGRQLRERGREVVLARPGPTFQRVERDDYVLDPGRREDATSLVEALAAEGWLPNVLVHAWTLTPEDESPAARITRMTEFEAAQARGLSSLLGQVQAWTPRPELAEEVRVIVVGDGLKSVAGEGVCPEKAPLLGLCRVLPQEFPGLRCRVLDVECPRGRRDVGVLATRILAEAADDQVDEIVAYRGRGRFVEAFERVRLEALPEGRSPVLREKGVYLLTGGLQGNGYAFAQYLARELRARLLLVEEAPIEVDGEAPKQDQRAQRVAALEGLGAEVRVVVNADPSDTDDLCSGIAAARQQWGALSGVLHSAGTDGENTFRAVAEIDDEHLGWHFCSKIHGVLALEAVLEKELTESDLAELDFCLVLSSLASVLGGLAYGAYTAANCFLEAFVADRERRGAKLPWISVGWDVWEFADEEQQITALRSDLAALAMTPRQGEQAFARLLGQGLGHVLVSTGDLGARIEDRRARVSNHRRTPPMAADGPLHPRPDLQTPFAAPEGELEPKIAAVWQEFLGFERIGAHDNFFDLGGDSFIAVRVAARLAEALDRDLPVAQLYQRLTVRSLAELLTQDAREATRERAAELAERRESMDRRKQLMKRRRARKNPTFEKP